MADRVLFTPRSIEQEKVDIHCIFSILGNTTPANGTFTIVEGGKAVGTLTRTGTGAYSVRITDKWRKLVGASVSIFPHNGAARGVKMGAVDVSNNTASSRTASFTIVNTAEAAIDTPNAETDLVYLNLHVKNSTAR